MEKTFGKLSYDPKELELFFWGGRNRYYGKFESKISHNIIAACYYDRLTEEQIALQLGMSTVYLEDELNKLLEFDLLTEKNGIYQSNVPVITKEAFADMKNAINPVTDRICDLLKKEIDAMIPEVRKIGFYGSNMPNNSLKWMLLSLILHLAYVDYPMGELELDYPANKFGEKCFRFFVEKNPADTYFFGTGSYSSRSGIIMFWDVPVNGEFLHMKMSETRADLVTSLLKHQPETENEKIVCTELLSIGAAVKTDKGIMPNFPCLSAEEGELLNKMISDIGCKIGRNVIDGNETIKRIMREHTPEHLIDYVDKMPTLLHFREAENVMQDLCECGWLLPLRGGMNATTVMYGRD